MKRLNILMLMLTIVVGAYAQQNGDGKVPFYPVVNDRNGAMPQEALSSLESKMHQMMTADGFGSASRADRFVIVAKPSIVTKDVAPTTPTRVSQTVEITFVVGDVVENKTFASCSLSLSGIGINEAKAWNTAIAKIKPTNDEIKKMLTAAYHKIEAYYSANCKTIIAKAETNAGLGNFEEAIASLIEVPDICAECFDEVQQKVSEIYQRKIDSEGATLLSKAKSEWSVSPDSKGAARAIEYLSKINLISAAYTEKESLEHQMMKKLSADEQRKWEEKQKRYNDEMKLRQREMQNSHQRQMATIAVCRSVAEKWAENQPKTNIYLNW